MSSSLNDLPPEIVENIMAQLVATLGLEQAWQFRTISPLFHAYIPREILGRQPMAAYRGQLNSLFLQKHLRQFLEYRMNALYGAPNDLPNLIRRIVDVMASVSNGISSATRVQWTQAAIRTAINYCNAPPALTLATKPTPNMKRHVAGITGNVEALAVAVMLDDQDLVRRLLDQGISMWTKTPLASSYSCAFDLASQRNNFPMVKFMLAYVQHGLSSSEKRKRTVTIRSSIQNAVATDDEMATELLQWYMTNNPNQSSDVSQRNLWLAVACNHGRMRFISELLDHARTPAIRTEYRDVFLGEWNKYSFDPKDLVEPKPELLKEMINLFLEKRVFAPHTIDDHSGKLLHIVITMGDVDLVQTVLDAGAHMDGVAAWPLISAIRGGRMRIVRMLLAKGADPEAGDHETRGMRTTLAGLKEGSKMYREISEAISKKNVPKKPLFD